MKSALNANPVYCFFKAINASNLRTAIMVDLLFLFFYMYLVAIFKSLSGTMNVCGNSCPNGCKTINN